MGRTYYYHLKLYTISTSYNRNLRQFAAIYSNLPIYITLPSTITTYAIIVRKEGKRSAYMDFRTIQLQDTSSLHFLKYSQCSQNILYWSIRNSNASLIWDRGNTQRTLFLITRRSQRINIHLQHRIVHIIVIYIFYTLLKYTNIKVLLKVIKYN